MIITQNMNAEELAQHFSEQKQDTTNVIAPPPTGNQLPGSMEELIASSSSDELAQKAEELKAGVVTPEGGDTIKKKEGDEGAAPKKAAKSTGTPLDESFVSQLDNLLFKTEKLRPFDNEDGSDYIRPKTWEELQEVIDANIEDVRTSTKNTEKQVLLNELFQESSPAVQFILQNANSFRTAEDMIPLIQSVQQQDDFASLDVKNPEHIEFIVENALRLQGLDDQSITEEIAFLKENNKLEGRAEKLKPLLDNYSAQKTEQILAQQEAKAQEDQVFWNGYYQQMNQDLLSAKDIDGMKIKPEHRQIIANALIPNQQLGGLPIYSIIDKLVGERNITRLSKAILLLADEELFDSYYGSKKSNEVAQGLQRQLRSSVKSSSSDNNQETPPQNSNTAPRPKYGNFLNS